MGRQALEARAARVGVAAGDDVLRCRNAAAAGLCSFACFRQAPRHVCDEGCGLLSSACLHGPGATMCAHSGAPARVSSQKDEV